MYPEAGGPELFTDGAAVSFVPRRQEHDAHSEGSCSGDGVRTHASEPQLLWIDDEISPENGGVLYLRFGGFRVHCAVTATAGLALARTGRYDGILLDLRLPDVSGLAVLASLRAEAITTPVLMLTGFGDFESARVAGRLGADAFHAKPLIGDELIAAVQQILRTKTLADASVGDSSSLSAGSRSSLASLATLLEVFHRLTQSTQRELSRKHASQTLAAALIQALVNPDLPMPIFIACAFALKLAKSSEVASASEQISGAEELVFGALSRPEPSDQRVINALEMIRSAALRRERLRIDVIAEAQNVDPTYLGRRIKAETGFDFTDWRTAFILRPGVYRLVEANDGIKEIARGLLDFKHLSQFDVEFHRFFGLTPTEFRDVGRHRTR